MTCSTPELQWLFGRVWRPSPAFFPVVAGFSACRALGSKPILMRKCKGWSHFVLCVLHWFTQYCTFSVCELISLPDEQVTRDLKLRMAPATCAWRDWTTGIDHASGLRPTSSATRHSQARPMIIISEASSATISMGAIGRISLKAPCLPPFRLANLSKLIIFYLNLFDAPF